MVDTRSGINANNNQGSPPRIPARSEQMVNPQNEPPAPLVEEANIHEGGEIHSQINRDVPQPHDGGNLERNEAADVERPEPPLRNDQESHVDISEASHPSRVRGRRRNRDRNQARDRQPGNDRQQGSGRQLEESWYLDRTYGSSRQSRESFNSSQMKVIRDMMYSTIHEAMTGWMPPPVATVPNQPTPAAVPSQAAAFPPIPEHDQAGNFVYAPAAEAPAYVAPTNVTPVIAAPAVVAQRIFDPVDTYGRAIKALTSNKADDYDGLGDPYRAVQWVLHIERILRGVNCTDRDRVNSATLRLKGAAGDWWESVRLTWEATPTWDAFKRKFTGHYFAPSLMDEKRREFLQPAPAGMKAHEIVQRYHNLKPYTRDILRTEVDEIHYFNEMLPYRLKHSLLHIPRTTLDSFIDATYRAEASFEEEKRNQDFASQQMGSQKHSGSKRAASGVD